MGTPFNPDPRSSFAEFIGALFDRYRGAGIGGTSVRLKYMRIWFSTVGRDRALKELHAFEESVGSHNENVVAERLWMAASSYKKLKDFVLRLPRNSSETPEDSAKKSVSAFISYKWESVEHQQWVMRLATDLRARGIDAKLDVWEVRLGGSFTEYMQLHIGKADVLLFVITSASVEAAEATGQKGGALKFEVQMMNARRIAEGTRIIGIYRSGERPPHYLRDHRYIDFRNDSDYENSLKILTGDLLDETGPPPLPAPNSAG